MGRHTHNFVLGVEPVRGGGDKPTEPLGLFILFIKGNIGSTTKNTLFSVFPKFEILVYFSDQHSTYVK